MLSRPATCRRMDIRPSSKLVLMPTSAMDGRSSKATTEHPRRDRLARAKAAPCITGGSDHHAIRPAFYFALHECTRSAMHLELNIRSFLALMLALAVISAQANPE